MARESDSHLSRQKMKILHVIEATVGGTRHHLTTLLKQLDKDQYEIMVVCPETRHDAFGDYQFIASVNKLDIRVEIVDMHREIRPLPDLRAFLKICRILRQYKFDIVHTHSSKAGFIGRLAARWAGIPAIYTPNGFYFLDVSHSYKKWMYTWLERFAGRFTERLIAVSTSEMHIAHHNRITSKDRVVLIENSIDVPEILAQITVEPPAKCRDLGLDPSKPIVGTVSRFIAQKDPGTWLLAARQIVKKHPGVQFVWCGSGPLEDATRNQAAALGLDFHIHFLGFRIDVLEIMNAFDIFLISSRYEGLPYSLLEAMALGKPIVGTDVVGIRDVVNSGQNGLLVPARQPVRLAEAVFKLLLDDNMRLSMGQTGLKMVNGRFGTETAMQKLSALYHEIASRDLHQKPKRRG